VSNHNIDIHPAEAGGFYAKCTCRLRSGVVEVRQQAEDWALHHAEQVERARTSLGTKTPSLKHQRDYYADMAAATSNAMDKRLWQQLADELTHRLNDGEAPNAGAPTLF
jgi:hypothetical protein